MQIYLHLGMGFSVRRLYVLHSADFRVEMMKPRRVEQWFFVIRTSYLTVG